MDNLLVSLNVSIPIFIMLGLGYFLRRLGFVSDRFISEANQLNFRVFLSCSIFNNLYRSGIVIGNYLSMMILAGIFYVLTAVISIYTVRPVVKEPAKRGTLANCIFRSNYSYIGIPMVSTICGAEGAAAAALVLAVMVSCGNVMTIIIYSVYSGEKVDLKKILKGIVTNPNLIALALGIVFLVTGWGERVPEFAAKPVKSLAGVSTPLALISLGASFSFSRLQSNRRLILYGNLMSLIIYPLIAVFISILAGFRGAALGALFALVACPAATVNFPLAQTMGGDPELASQQVVTQSAFFILTSFLFVFALKSLGLV